MGNKDGADTGGGAIVQGLLDHGIETVFGLPGAQIYGLFDALAQAKDSIRTIGARHEQGVAYMAYGYARASGRPGVYAVVPGPGMLNTGAALLTAFGANAPVLCLTGQVTSDYLGRERGQLHELRNHLDVLRALRGVVCRAPARVPPARGGAPPRGAVRRRPRQRPAFGSARHAVAPRAAQPKPLPHRHRSGGEAPGARRYRHRRRRRARSSRA